jgi:hypothetical protein
MFAPRKRAKGTLALSIGIHVFIIAAIASITFRYPLGAFLGLTRERIELPEHVQYVRVQPAPRGVEGGSRDRTPSRRPEKPAPLLAPSTIPSALPPITLPKVPTGVIGGTGTGSGGAPAGIATGIEPADPDPRLDLQIGRYSFPKSPSQRADSAVRAIFDTYRDAVIAAEANRGRSPRDWTVEKNGGKYGLDSQYIYLGKFKLPSAILAALPFNTAGVDGQRMLDNRNADWIRQDILAHAQGMSQDDFRAAVKRIRERKEREKQDEDKAKAKPIASGKP